MTMHIRKAVVRDIAQCPLYGISPLALADHFLLPEWFCARWKAQLRRTPADAQTIARYVNRDLGAFDPAWAGWLCKDGLLWPPDSTAVDPGQVRAIPHLRAQLGEWHRAQRWMLESSLQDQRRRQVRAEVEDLLERAIEALRQR